ncbi:MAG: ABC transporter ATP-binding protein [Aestuariivita sp.]|nr:ABC transporter ATP-binding protein [Aestuariivita sp.]MCY4201536.1 ABC transporter ATP-binding protein [Aestuariivita sp.]MCY4289823.1 ABC transporter ATP-binding protein [Aestuariivita sp.]MCY4345632.1 ABC transporter ATP-binding protein [Aestuariivita sp.]
MSHDPPAIELKSIYKAFGSIQANKDISITVAAGSIHGIVGENGAGKSTLMSILYGFYKADQGEIYVKGKQILIRDSQSAISFGIGMVFQHFKLVENFTVLENIILGSEKGYLLTPALNQTRTALYDLGKDYELNVDLDAEIKDLSVGLQQRVEILKVLYRGADILILDEPTGVLTPTETEQLFRILRRLRNEGKTIILITHKLREIMEITDQVSVMRRGEMVGHLNTPDTTPEELAEMMVGRKVIHNISKSPASPKGTVLQVENLNVVDDLGVERVKGISFSVCAGEVLGIAGVAGNGQSELLEVLGGMRNGTGVVQVSDQQLDLSGPKATGKWRRNFGIAHVPEDRQREGLVMEYFAWENVAFGYHRDARYQKNPFTMDNSAIRKDAVGKMGRFDVRPRNPWLRAKNFSGGNQQKIVVAREFERKPNLLLVGQPTRGIDIGAVEFVHRQIIALRDQGTAILLVSVELSEILSLADRIAVMFDGRIMGERLPEQTDERELSLLMTGIIEQGHDPAI